MCFLFPDPYVFPAGSNMYIPIIHLHKDPDVWPEPEKFDPDRFLPDEVAKRHRCSYIPFSFGARNCIGRCLSEVGFFYLCLRCQICYDVNNSNTCDDPETLQGTNS